MLKIWVILMTKHLFPMIRKLPKKYLSTNRSVKFCLKKNTLANLKSISKHNFGMPLASQLPKKSINKKIINKDREAKTIEAVIVEGEATIKKTMVIEITEIEGIIETTVSTKTIEIVIVIMIKKATTRGKAKTKKNAKIMTSVIIVDLN